MLKKILFLFIASVTVSCSDGNDELLVKLRKEMLPLRKMKSGYKTLNLDSLTDFPWDSVYFFQGEEGGAYVNGKIGFNWDGPSVPNLHKRLLFVKGRTVATYIDFNEEESVMGNSQNNYPMPIWMFNCPGGGYGIARKQARFISFRYCEKGIITYPLVPIDCLEHYQHLLTQGCQNLSDQQIYSKRLDDSIKSSLKSVKQGNSL